MTTDHLTETNPDGGGYRTTRPTRRDLIRGGGLLALLLGGLVATQARTASADVATGGLAVQGDSIATDNGRLTSLTASVSGHASYDGLDTEAAQVTVALSAAPTGGAVADAGNRIASTTADVSTTTGLGTNAGHLDYGFTDADVLAARDLAAADFAATADGTTATTDVDFRVGIVVTDGSGTELASAADVTTTTVEVTNQARSAGNSGSGSTNAGGTNQSP